MLLAVLLLTARIFSPTSAYTLVEDFSGSNFLSGFNFFSGTDPTHGFVRYLNRADAESQGLISVSDSSIYIGVDSKHQAANGRASVRLESKGTYSHGLFILDLEHMPGGTCGTWPSFWTYGQDGQWPASGEIDIIEGVHTSTTNGMSLHTTDGCSVGNSLMAGSVKTPNCYIRAPGQSANTGCLVESSSAESYGTGFNERGGGVYAMEWTSTAIRIFFFSRSSLPADIRSSSPDPSTWGTPQANFGGSCDIDKHFSNHRIILDTTFCGDWAGATWSSTPQCAALAGSCIDYVRDNPADFRESYWRIRSLRIYQ
ncbi:hypothetical protein GQ43DRAFT_419682 [Delitschia confertaspora ATCC 74209]|uniref:endo-1,3(4)-beta-glucanase n=1 Tax=Delitschia confertaspora ATCC 74209 TaxID=1513339 RepID=A0A9P4MNM9_9PLEO|nr:hypothetical protein GQ43DRAFT_419682 [Delitschia confertaspora ATCC 74209]